MVNCATPAGREVGLREAGGGAARQGYTKEGRFLPLPPFIRGPRAHTHCYAYRLWRKGTPCGLRKGLQSAAKVYKVMSVYRVTVKTTFNGTDDQFNVHHYEFPNYVPDDTELQEFVDNMGAAYFNRLETLCPSQLTFNSIECRRVDQANLPSADLIPDTWPDTGNNGGGCLPPQCSAMLRFTAPVAFPRTARVYLPLFGKTAAGAVGDVGGAALALCDALALDLEQISVTGQVDAQKVAVKYTGTPRVVTVANVVFAQSTRGTFQTQRRRTPGVGS